MLRFPTSPSSPPVSPYARGDALFHLQGRRLRVTPEGDVDWPYELTDEERKLGPFGIVNKYLLSAFAGMDDPVAAGALPEWLREQDDKTLLEFAARRGASPSAQEMIRHGNWFGARSDTASAASTLTADLAPTHDTAPLAFVGGSGRRQDRVIADQVVCAIPFPVLRHIEAAPALSPATQTVVNGLEYLSVTRVFLQMRQRFWENGGVAGNASTDLAIGELQKQPLIRTHAQGDRAILEAHARWAGEPLRWKAWQRMNVCVTSSRRWTRRIRASAGTTKGGSGRAGRLTAGHVVRTRFIVQARSAAGGLRPRGRKDASTSPASIRPSSTPPWRGRSSQVCARRVRSKRAK